MAEKTLAEKMTEYNAKKRAEYEAVMAGAAPPPCSALAVIGKPERCGAVSAFVTKGITPAGYHSWCCAKHRPRDETDADMRGSDPGWPTTWECVEQARTRTLGVAIPQKESDRG